jgi:hypothetical protein
VNPRDRVTLGSSPRLAEKTPYPAVLFLPYDCIAPGLVPLENTVPVQHLRGPSYIYAILMDPRIRQDDW